jgi:hypothetical protein
MTVSRSLAALAALSLSFSASPAFAQDAWPNHAWQGWNTSSGWGSASRNTYSREDVLRARHEADRAYRHCLATTTVSNVAAQAFSSLANRIINGRRSYSGGYYQNNDWQCRSEADRIYRDLLSATPDSGCETTLSTRVRRGGSYVDEPIADRRCYERTEENWGSEFRPSSAPAPAPAVDRSAWSH